jgi:hypothetical protein
MSLLTFSIDHLGYAHCSIFKRNVLQEMLLLSFALSFQMMRRNDLLKYLFMKQDHRVLTFPKLKLMMKPKCSPEGSNRHGMEKVAYANFLKYAREVAGKYNCWFYG